MTSSLCWWFGRAGPHGRGGEESVASAVRRHGRSSGHDQGQFHLLIWFDEPETTPLKPFQGQKVNFRPQGSPQNFIRIKISLVFVNEVE